MNFAVVDIETTGLYHQGHGITEIAVIHITDKKIEPVFKTLINPKRSIPKSITHLTGIETSMTTDAKNFKDIAHELYPLLENRIFVAHNVNFDYNFLKAAFENINMNFKPHRFCTMKYARKLLPQLKTHKLNAVCGELKIENTQVHRAYGDAMATAKVLLSLLDRDKFGFYDKLIKQNNGHVTLPGALDIEKFNAIPQTSGVYYFYGSNPSKPIYIGKAINLKSRINSHFTSSGKSPRQQIFQRVVTHLDYKTTGSEYEALLLEDAEIKKHMPVFNIAQKKQGKPFAIIPFQNRQNQTRLAILKTADRADAIAWFNSAHQARSWLLKELLRRDIDPRSAGMFAEKEYNSLESHQNLQAFIKEQTTQLDDQFVLELRSNSSPHFGVVVRRGKYRGYGYFNGNETTFEEIESKMVGAQHSPVALYVIQKMLQDENVNKQTF